MVYAFIGVGQAGCALLDALMKYKPLRKICKPLAINSTAKDLMNLKNVKKDNWIGVSASRGFVKATEKDIVFEEVVTGGFGKNPYEASKVAEDNYDSLVSIFQEYFSEDMPPFAFVFNSLGGGTGCGIAPYVARALKDVNEDIKVISVCILPAIVETVECRNATYGLERIKNYVNAVFLVDNQRIAYRADYDVLFPNYNLYVASAIADIVSGTLLENIDPSKYEINPPVIDLNDLITAVSFDSEPGFAGIGRKSMLTRSIIQYYIPVGGHKYVDVHLLCKMASRRLTLDGLTLRDAKKGLVVVRVPVYYLKKEGRIDINSVRDFFEEEGVKDTFVGVTLTKRNLASVTLVLTFRYSDLRKRIQLSEEKESRVIEI
jgi:cell division GTPase FtsZ